MLQELATYLASNQIVGGMVGVGLAGGATVALRNTPGRVGRFVFRHLTVELEVSNDQPAYYWLAALFERRIGKRARKVSIVRGWDMGAAYNNAAEGEKLHVIAGLGSHVMWLAGVPTLVRRSREKDSQTSKPRESMTLTVPFWMRARLAPLVEAAKSANDAPVNHLRVYSSSRDGEWKPAGLIRKRPLSSVVLAPGIAERITSAVRKFTASRAWYADAHVPYRMGLLLEGPPGTGKSSVAHAVASDFGLPVYSLNLADVGSDDSLFGLFRDLPAACVVLVEDVDAAAVSVLARSDEGDAPARRGVTLSGLLNALDGAVAAQGRIVIMSSNHPERLDPALLRPGRCDIRVHLGLADAEQAARMHELLFPGREGAEAFGAAHAGESHAAVQEALLALRADT